MLRHIEGTVTVTATFTVTVATTARKQYSFHMLFNLEAPKIPKDASLHRAANAKHAQTRTLYAHPHLHEPRRVNERENKNHKRERSYKES